MARDAMKVSLALSVMAVLLLGYSNCSNPHFQQPTTESYSSSSTKPSGIQISPAAKTIKLGDTLQFETSGGTAPYKYTLTAGGGYIDANTGLYTSPDFETDAVILVEDVRGLQSQAQIKTSLNASTKITLAYAPTGTISLNSVLTLTASGGTAPYSYFVASGVGTIVDNKYTASSFGNAVIAVKDSAGEISTFAIVVGSSVTITTAPIYQFYHSVSKQYFFGPSMTSMPSGYSLQSSSAAFKVLTGTYLSSAELIRCYIPSNGGRYLTASGSCGSYTQEIVLGRVWTYPAANAVPLYNCFKPSTGTYFSTTDYSACVNNGFNVQSPVIGYVPK